MKTEENKCTPLFNRIAELEKEYINFWIDICKIESPSNYKEGVDQVGIYFINKAKMRNWKVEVQKQEISGDCICITMNADSKKAPIVFSGHMDTVFEIGSFGKDVVTLDEEKIYGPGVIDCKGGIVAAFYAMAALEDCGFKERPVKLILQSDEEVSSCYSNKETVKFMAAKAEDCVAFLNCEPFGGRGVAIERKGISHYEFEVSGKAAHASYCYNGANAICEAAYKIIELEKMKDPKGITCNCGIVQGGTVRNVVADRCVFTADIRFNNEQEMLKVDEIVRKIAEETHINGTSCKVTLKSRRCAMEKNEKNEKLFHTMNAIFEEVGLPELIAYKRNGGSDAADMTSYGIPCIDCMGTEGGLLHSTDEFSYLKSLAEAAKRLAAVAYCI